MPHTSAAPPRPRGQQGADIQMPRTLRAQRPCRWVLSHQQCVLYFWALEAAALRGLVLLLQI